MKKHLFFSAIFISHLLTAQNIGIGITNPQAKLHIASSSDEVIRLNSDQPYLSLFSNGAYKGYFWKSPNSIEIGSAAGTNLPITIAPDGLQRMFVTANGNVGIGTDTPAEKLEITGNIMATSYKFPVPKTYYYSISPSAFRPTMGADVITSTYTGASLNSSPTPTGGLIVPIYLPHGAVMNTMTAYYMDNSATTDIKIHFLEHLHGLGGGGTLGFTQSSGTPGDGYGIFTIVFPIVNNITQDYSILVTSTAGPWPGSDLIIRGIVISYTLSEVY